MQMFCLKTYQISIVDVWNSILNKGECGKLQNTKLLLCSLLLNFDKTDLTFFQLIVNLCKIIRFKLSRPGVDFLKIALNYCTRQPTF